MKIKKNIAGILIPLSILIGGTKFSNAQNNLKEQNQKKIYNTLNSKIFNIPEDTVLLKKRLSIHSEIKPIFLDSTNFENKKDNIITNEKNNKSDFVLYLPINLKIKNIPNIIKQINHFTFGKNLPKQASYKELEKYFIENIEFLEKTENKSKKIENEIGKYKELYSKNFGDKTNENNKTDSLYTDFLYNIKNDTLEKMENALSTILEEKLYESILEYGTKSFSNIIIAKKILPINSYKQQLKNTKKENLFKIQRHISNDIVKKIHNSKFFKEPDASFFIEPDVLLDQSSPSQIIKKGEIQCIGYSQMLHYIFQELGIQHYVISTPMHSSVIIETNGLYHLCDIKSYDEIKEISVDKKYLNNWKISRYENQLDKKNTKVSGLISMGDPEKEITGQLLSVTAGHYQKDNNEIVEDLVLNSLKLSPTNYYIVMRLLNIYKDLGKKKEAWELYQDFFKKTKYQIPYMSIPEKP